MYNAIIVDDEPRAVQALVENIDWKACGIFKVYTASNISSAKKVIAESKVEILICDIEMPNGYGTQLLEWIRENNISMNCIFVTCHQEYSIMRKAIQLKCYDYVLKPIDYDDFSRLLMDMVEKMENNWGDVLPSDVLKKEKENARNIEMEVKRYVKEHLSDNILISDIANHLHFNPNYLMRAFKSETGLSILEYIVRARMEAAKKILKGTRLPVKDVAYMVGYMDGVYFTKVFHKETGMTPSQYRKEMDKK